MNVRNGYIKEPDPNAVAEMKVRVQDNLVVVELGTAWFALGKEQVIKFVQALAECANRLPG